MTYFPRRRWCAHASVLAGNHHGRSASLFALSSSPVTLTSQSFLFIKIDPGFQRIMKMLCHTYLGEKTIRPALLLFSSRNTSQDLNAYHGSLMDISFCFLPSRDYRRSCLMPIAQGNGEGLGLDSQALFLHLPAVLLLHSRKVYRAKGRHDLVSLATILHAH